MGKAGFVAYIVYPKRFRNSFEVCVGVHLIDSRMCVHVQVATFSRRHMITPFPFLSKPLCSIFPVMP